MLRETCVGDLLGMGVTQVHRPPLIVTNIYTPSSMLLTPLDCYEHIYTPPLMVFLRDLLLGIMGNQDERKENASSTGDSLDVGATFDHVNSSDCHHGDGSGDGSNGDGSKGDDSNDAVTITPSSEYATNTPSEYATNTPSEYATNTPTDATVVHTMSPTDIAEYYHFTITAIIHCSCGLYSDKGQGCNNDNNNDRDKGNYGQSSSQLRATAGDTHSSTLFPPSSSSASSSSSSSSFFSSSSSATSQNNNHAHPHLCNSNPCPYAKQHPLPLTIHDEVKAFGGIHMLPPSVEKHLQLLVIGKDVTFPLHEEVKPG